MTRKDLLFRLQKKISVLLVGIFGHVCITTGCFERSVKTLDDVNIPWDSNNELNSWLKALLDLNGF